jgi:type VI secretion system secreted protein Hcp
MARQSRKGITVRKLRILLCIFAPALALGALVPASAPAATDMYLQADGLLGESQADRYANAIDVLAFSWGASSAAGGATTTAKPNFQDINISKYVDRSSPTLLTNLATGRVIARAKLTFVKAGENPAPFLRFCFTGVRVTSVQVSGSDEDRANENVSFSYATVVEAYQRQNADGSLAPAVFGGWDLINKLQYGDPTC